jgi:fimbrial chaperone protein
MTPRPWAAALLTVAAAWSLPLRAAVIQLAPIPVEIRAPQTAAVLSLGNRASAEVALQTRVFRWTQENGEDRLTPTTDLVVSPPIAKVPAGQSLVVRVVRVLRAPSEGEETYRVLVDELPPEKRTAKGQSLQILMRYSVPVFYQPEGIDPREPTLTWQLARQGDGALRLSAGNPGQRRVRVSGVQLRDAAGRPATLAAGSELNGYVLAGQTMQWTLKPPKDFAIRDGAYRLDYQTEARRHRENVVLGASR